MNKIKKILFTIYQNWFLVSMALICLFHWTIGVSWEWMYVPGIWFVLSLCAHRIRHSFFAPIRMLIWPLLKAGLVKRCERSPLVGYPMIMWIEFNARNHYLEGGWPKLKEEFNKKITTAANALSSLFDKTVEQSQPIE